MQLGIVTYNIAKDWDLPTIISKLEALGYDRFDAVHLALAEAARADFLLTTDDRFLRRARRSVGKPALEVLNPLEYRKVMP